MSTTSTGRDAETLAADFLHLQGYTILNRNWHNRWCELDIVARKGPVVHFIEVKYRADVRYGYASEYINRDKSSRLIRAATAWCQAHRYDGMYQIDVITVEGNLEHPQIELISNAVSSY